VQVDLVIRQYPLYHLFAIRFLFQNLVMCLFLNYVPRLFVILFIFPVIFCSFTLISFYFLISKMSESIFAFLDCLSELETFTSIKIETKQRLLL